MFIKYDSDAVILTGRWGKNGDAAVATACGSKIEFAFCGNLAVMRFDMTFSEHPYPHVWIQVDGGARVESTIEKYVRVYAESEGPHTVTVVYKGAVEMQHRWYAPLIGKIAFMGFEADGAGVLEPVDRRYIEFIGDSITEGVLVDEECRVNSDNDQLNRPFQDDVTATYAYLTAQALGMEPLVMGYGAVGLTRGGCGSVPAVGEAYEYCFNGCETELPEPECIVINHGANDWGSVKEKYFERYGELLDMVSEKHPEAKVFAVGAFCGWCHEELEGFVEEYNAKTGRNVIYINTYGWLPPDPLHPGRAGHKKASEHLAAEIRKFL